VISDFEVISGLEGSEVSGYAVSSVTISGVLFEVTCLVRFVLFRVFGEFLECLEFSDEAIDSELFDFIFGLVFSSGRISDTKS